MVEERRRRRRRRILFISFLIAVGSLGAVTESRAYDVLAYAFTNVHVASVVDPDLYLGLI